MQNSTNGLSIGGMVIGIISLLFSFIPCIGMLGGILALVGFILSLIGYRSAKDSGGPTSMGVAGMVLSGIAILVALAWGTLIAKAGSGEPFEASTCEEVLEEMDKAVKEMNAISAKGDDADVSDLTSVLKTTTLLVKIKSKASELKCEQDSTFKAKMDILNKEMEIESENLEVKSEQVLVCSHLKALLHGD